MSYDPYRSRGVPTYDDDDEEEEELNETLVDIEQGPSGPGHVSWHPSMGAELYGGPLHRRIGRANTVKRTNDRVVENLGPCVHRQDLVSILNTIQALKKEKSIVLGTRPAHKHQTRTATAKAAERTREVGEIEDDIERLQTTGRELLKACGFDERAVPALVSSFGGKRSGGRRRAKVLNILRLLGFM